MKKPKRVLLLGAGGMGMAPLALYIQGAGIQVEAYDDRFSEPMRSQLIAEGIEVLGEPIPTSNPDCVIRSSAIPEEDPKVLSWSKKGVSVYRREGIFSQSLLLVGRCWQWLEVTERLLLRECSYGRLIKWVFPVPTLSVDPFRMILFCLANSEGIPGWS